MTGGGTRVLRGAMSSTLTEEFSPDALRRMEHELEQAENEYRFFQQEKVSLEREVNSTIVNVPKMKMRLSMFQMDIQANESRIADSVKRVDALRRDAEPKPAEVAKMKQLAKKAEELRAEVLGIKKNAQSIEGKIKDLQNKILDAGGVKLRAQKSKVEGLRDQIEALGDKITKTKVAKNKAEKDVVKLGTQIAKHEKELSDVSVDLEKLEQEIKEKSQEAAGIRKKAEEAKHLMEDKSEEMATLKQELDSKVKVIQKIRTAEVEMKNQLDDLKQSVNENERRVKHWNELLQGLSLQEVDYDEDEIVAELHEIGDTDLDMIDKHELEQQINRLQVEISATKPNLSVLEEYKKREEEYLARAKDLEEITERREEAKKAFDELRKRRLDEFMEGFQIISLRLKEMYQMITLGGNAELELVDSLDPFSEGIIFSVMPPKKSWKNISNLSGGEKTLSSLALVFALHHFKPTPLYVMDEIDAALDFRNVSIVANYIKERTKNAQFVIISLRNNMFELADRLVGIYKTDNKTKSIAINPTSMTVLRPTPVLSQGSSNTMHGHPAGGGQGTPGGPRRMSAMSRHNTETGTNHGTPSASSQTMAMPSTPRPSVSASQ
ncbi:Structural maintenance of chromosomes protein 4 [Lunasporangiospora selenospora]|uniref:Structural maintenance of chromosomes protein 4 n=1 Tax=Lunasporangiospora selenospora TaxID=979761 RepID=A0A9P6KHA7_9FUNG|nr:Structural maintenance of chromosomes protein 4 [Lunasporangiospora selenospora]